MSRTRIAQTVLAASLIALALFAAGYVTQPHPHRIDDTIEGARIHIGAEQSLVFIPSTCFVLSWDTANIDSIYVNGEGTVGTGTRRVCPWDGQDVSVRIRLPSGTELVYSGLTVVLLTTWWFWPVMAGAVCFVYWLGRTLARYQAQEPVHPAAWIGSLWLMALAGIVLCAKLPASGAITTTFAFLAFLALPGALTAELLRVRERWSRIQTAAISAVLGIAEAVIIGRIAVYVGMSVTLFAGLLVLLGLGKIAMLIQRRTITPVQRAPLTLGMALQIVAVLFVVLAVLARVQAIPDRVKPSFSDFWNYVNVQVQFLKNPTDPNFQDGLIIPSVNARLKWNSWHYTLAMLNGVSDTHPIEFQGRDVLFALHTLALIVAIAFARELLQHRTVAYSAGLFQILFLMLSEESIFGPRIMEDKFVSLFIIIPAALMVVMRLLERPQCREWWLAAAILLGMSLTHPFNALAFNYIAAPYIVVRAVFGHETISRTHALRVLALCVVLIIVPVTERLMLEQSQHVQSAMAEATTVGWDYTAPSILFKFTRNMPMFLIGIGALLLLLTHARTDPGVLFITVGSSVIVLGLWIPGTAALFARVVTTSQNWRIFWLMPMGYLWGWLFLAAWKYGKHRLSERAVAVLRPAVPLIPLLLIPFLFTDLFDHTRYLFPRTSFAEGDWTFFEQGQALAGEARVGASPETSRYIASFWPDVYILLYVRSDPVQDNADLETLFDTPTQAALEQVAQRYDLDYLLYLRSDAINASIDEAWGCCTRVLESPSYILDAVMLDNPQ